MQCKLRRLALSAPAATLCLASLAASLPVHADEPFKIGFPVKTPEQVWFINEQEAATELSREDDFPVVNIDTSDGEKALSVIDNLGTQGVKGFAICAPDVCLGLVISARVKHYNMKFVTVDDQLVDSSDKSLVDVSHLGMSAFKISNQVGQTISDETRHHDWESEEVGTLRIINYELPTAKLRIDGATRTLLIDGFKKENIFDMSQKTTDDAGDFNATSSVLAQHTGIKKWVIFALNEESVLDDVRAIEQLHIPIANVIGVGINGAGEAFAEFQKREQTGFFGMITVSSTNHGKESAVNFVEWIKTGKQPPADT